MNFNLRRNTLWSVLEVCVSGLSLFLLYKFVIGHLGLKALGLWSLVLATSSLARLGDIGAATGLSRFVAFAIAQANEQRARQYVETALIANSAIYLCLSLLLFLPLRLGLEAVAPPDSFDEAARLLPYGMASFVLLNVSAVALSALVGQQRTDLKSKVVIVGTFSQILVAFIAVPRFGLHGMAWGQIAQGTVTVLIAWLVFLRNLKAAHRVTLPIGFQFKLFRELFGFGVRLQFSNLVSFAFEPATKFVMSAVSGLETLGLFEMTYRMVLQVRHITAAPTVALVPAFVELQESSPSEIPRLYERSVANIIFGGSLLFLVALSSPIIGLAWTGAYSTQFVLFAWLLSVGWFFNLLGTPAYQLAISRALIRWNILGHLLTSAGSPLLVFLLGQSLGPIGSVFGVAAALGAGAVYSMKMNCKHFGIAALPTAATIFGQLPSALRRPPVSKGPL
ncbi:lipopolysaccharide biosynthesis protein [Bradyrhizobium genomosp. III]|uniref:lipopolysaccharide biosynthesis protein n=1 Tax=Bradyrhizobium genomosp. III TaxID=2683271 RepID=UPI0004B0AAB4|nr:oligosaccharide flippase family protein [Bradyrhizobium sp. CCBAU 15635]